MYEVPYKMDRSSPYVNKLTIESPKEHARYARGRTNSVEPSWRNSGFYADDLQNCVAHRGRSELPHQNI
mgnify:FL=1